MEALAERLGVEQPRVLQRVVRRIGGVHEALVTVAATPVGEEQTGHLSALAFSAQALSLTGDTQTAGELLEAAVAAQERLGAPRTRRSYESLLGLGSIAIVRDEPDSAEAILLEALEGTRELLGEHQLTNEVRAALGYLYLRTGRLDESKQLNEESLAFFEETFGPEEPRTLDAMSAYGVLLREMGDYDAAEAILDRVLEIRERVLGAEAGAVFVSRHELALLALHRGSPEEAESRLLELFEDPSGMRRVLLTHQLAETYLALGKLDESDAYLAEAEGKFLAQVRPVNGLQIRRVRLEWCLEAGAIERFRRELDTARNVARAVLPDDHFYHRQLDSIEARALLLEDPDSPRALALMRGAVEALRESCGSRNHRTRKFGHTHSFHHFRSYDDLRSLPVMLAEAGYRTAIVGKFHVAPEEVYRFETKLPGNARNPIEMAENARAFLAAETDQPFFLYFATSDPHRGRPLDVAEPADDALVANSFGNRPDGYDGVSRTRYDPADVIVPPFLPDTRAAKEELAQYYESVSRLDQGVGRLVEILEDAGVYEQTLFLYMSDHGIAFPGAKTTVYEPGLRSPLIVRNPYSTKRGHVNDAMVSWVDITPTILDFAGAPSPKYTEENIRLPESRASTREETSLHGRSFLPVLEETSPEGWDEVYASHTFHEIQMYYPMRVVRERRYKLIWNIAHGLPFPFASDLWAASTWQDVYRQGMDARYGPRTVRAYIHRPEFELYDVEADPLESRNLAGDPKHGELLARLAEKIRAFQRRTSDPWLLKWEYE